MSKASTVRQGQPAAAHMAAMTDRLAGIDDLAGRIRRIAEAVPGRITFSTSLGIEDQAILHAIAASGATIDVFTLDIPSHVAGARTPASAFLNEPFRF